VQRQPTQHGLAGQVAELHAVQLHPGRVGGQLGGARLLVDRRLGVDDLEHPDHAGLGFLAEGDQVGEHPHRPHQLGQVGGEGQERAQRDRAADGQPAAEREHPDLAERRDRGERRAVAGHQPHGAHPQREQQPARPFQPLEFLLLLAEALDHPDPGDRRLDVPGHRAGLLLRRPAGREQLAPGDQRDGVQRGPDEQRDQGQHRGQEQHDDQ
jgi:hypothetical protein